MNTCLYCGAEKQSDQMAMKDIVHQVIRNGRKQVVTDFMGPFCLDKYKDDCPPCGTCYQMSCEG